MRCKMTWQRSRLAVIVWLALSLLGCRSTVSYAEKDAIDVGHQNASESAGLPKVIPADTLRLDSPTLEVPWLLELLSQRNVQMIEVAPQPLPNDPQLSRIAPGPWGGTPWDMAIAPYMFVQLRLSKYGDESCSTENVPNQNAFLRLHPETCLSVKTSLKSIARYRLRYVDKKESGGPYARWAMIDTKTDSTLASLPTVDKPGWASRTSRFQSGSNVPFITLVRLVDNSASPRSAPYLAYLQKSVTANIRPSEVYFPEPNAQVRSSYQFVDYSQNQFRSMRQEWQVEWKQAVGEAERTSWGHYYGSELIDQSLGTVISFRTGSDLASTVRVADHGFYVFPYNWKETDRNWLARYDSRGQFEWMTWILPPEKIDDGMKCKMTPHYLVSNANELTFVGLCDPVPSDDRAQSRANHRVRQIAINKLELIRALRSVGNTNTASLGRSSK